jgi:hypothetical protein
VVQQIIGYVLIVLGIAMEVIGVLVWLGQIKLPPGTMLFQSAGPWDFLTELLKKAPWTAVVGLLLIYAGLKMIGSAILPF